MKLTTKQLKKVIKEEIDSVLNEFYDSSGPHQSREGEIIDPKAWLKAFEEKGIEVPRSYHYQSNFKINPRSDYRGAWGIQYDALADSGGPFAEELEQRAIEIHNQMKRDAARGPQLSDEEEEKKRIKDIRGWTDDEFMDQIKYMTDYHKENPDVMDKALLNRVVQDWINIRKRG